MGKRIFLLTCLILLPACVFSSSQSPISAKKDIYFNQAQVNALVAAGRFEQASQLFYTHQSMYGSKNELLYLLDRAYVLQLAKKYDESSRYFEQAKNTIDQLYTKSVSNMASTWMVNDNLAPYRAEAFEQILVNVLQGLNYLARENILEALVEARDGDQKLSLLCDLYCHEKNIYSEDGFARFIFGLMYESKNNRQDINDAVISYKKALRAYENDFYRTASRGAPQILKENLLAASQYLGQADFQNYQKNFWGAPFSPLQEKMRKAEIYIIHFNGLSPVKHATTIVVPLLSGMTQMAFPQYAPRYYEIQSSEFIAVKSDGQKFSAITEVGADLEKIAQQSLDGRKAWLYAKAALRPLGKYTAESHVAQRVEKRHGELAGWAIKGVSSLYNLYSEQADVRSWQTLPAQIRIARVIVEPGQYHIRLTCFNSGRQMLEEVDLGGVVVNTGQKKFILVRTVK